MRIAVIQLGYDDREPVADRVTRAADLVRAQLTDFGRLTCASP